MKKKSNGITLVLSPLLGTMLFCSGGEEASARDVYKSQDECAKDWTSDLCEQMNEEDEKVYAGDTGGGDGGGGGVHYFWGPRYYGSNRSVSYQGRTITPAGKSTSLSSYSISSRSSSSSRGGKSSPSSTTTGGFGSRSGSTSGS